MAEEIVVFDKMLDQVITVILKQRDNEELIFVTGNGFHRFYHDQSCCEHVMIDDIVGDLKNLIGVPLLQAESFTRVSHVTYTFYTFSTVRGTVTVKWIGESNGYYSEEVDYMYLEELVPYLLETRRWVYNKDKTPNWEIDPTIQRFIAVAGHFDHPFVESSEEDWNARVLI